MPMMDFVTPQEIVGDVEECVIVTWLKRAGDDIEKDEHLLILQAAKTSYDIPSPVSGKVVEILADQGDIVSIDQVLARIETVSLLQMQKTEPSPVMPPAGRQKPQGENDIPFTGMREMIARRMHDSLQNMAQLTLFSEADVFNLVLLKQSLPEKVITYTDLVIRACCLALRRQPRFNSTLEADTIHRLPHIHIGIAVSLEEGLMVPVIFDADRKSLKKIAAERRRLADDARQNRLAQAESSGSTFTVTNLGGYDIGHFTPIINPPEAAILGIGRISEKIVYYQGMITHRPVIPLSLSFDHRINDGAQAAAFLQSIKEHLEDTGELT